MKLEQLVGFMIEHPWAISTGAKKIAKSKHCTLSEVVEARRIAKKAMEAKKPLHTPKILLFDIETAPMKAFVWERWKQNIALNETISEWFILCWSAKWLYSNEVMGESVTKEEVANEDDSRIVKDLWKLFDEADIVVAHNGNRFDIPKVNSRFVIHGLTPPSSYFKVDTCNVAKYTFGFSSNKLDALASYFGVPNKLETSFELWKDCLNGSEEALKYMLEYNKKDVEILEQVYLRLRPFIKGHPNIQNLVDKVCCCKCGSEKLERLEGKYYYTSVSKFQLYRCRECGAVVRGRKNLASKVQNVNTCR